MSGAAGDMMMIEVPVPPALADRRNELKCFLRTRRERLQPADVNLPCGTRRRTPGLRREEVAELAGVGVAWYSWLEMGREIRVSSRMLLGIARALKLSEDETAYLFTLAGNAVPERDCDFPETVPVWMEEVLRRIRGPAYFIGRRLDVLAWNEHAERLFNFYESADPLQSSRALSGRSAFRKSDRSAASRQRGISKPLGGAGREVSDEFRRHARRPGGRGARGGVGEVAIGAQLVAIHRCRLSQSERRDGEKTRAPSGIAARSA
ncbi:MAG: helix-turn-helix transcriptional regulator [Vulcanimicrobiaceae bacterium]